MNVFVVLLSLLRLEWASAKDSDNEVEVTFSVHFAGLRSSGYADFIFVHLHFNITIITMSLRCSNVEQRPAYLFT